MAWSINVPTTTKTPDEYLIARHEREIFPLLKRRYLFAEVDNFYLYDFITLENKVDEKMSLPLAINMAMKEHL